MPVPTHSVIDELRAFVLATLHALSDGIASGPVSLADWDRAREALEAVPLSTEDTGTARNRLGNARAYYDAGESGAAHFELRLLTQSLKNH